MHGDREYQHKPSSMINPNGYK